MMDMTGKVTPGAPFLTWSIERSSPSEADGSVIEYPTSFNVIEPGWNNLYNTMPIRQESPFVQSNQLQRQRQQVDIPLENDTLHSPLTDSEQSSANSVNNRKGEPHFGSISNNTSSDLNHYEANGNPVFPAQSEQGANNLLVSSANGGFNLDLARSNLLDLSRRHSVDSVLSIQQYDSGSLSSFVINDDALMRSTEAQGNTLLQHQRSLLPFGNSQGTNSSNVSLETAWGQGAFQNNGSTSPQHAFLSAPSASYLPPKCQELEKRRLLAGTASGNDVDLEELFDPVNNMSDLLNSNLMLDISHEQRAFKRSKSMHFGTDASSLTVNGLQESCTELPFSNDVCSSTTPPCVPDMSNPSAIPRQQSLRYDGDQYTPEWVRFMGQLKEGYCSSCKPGKWLQLKNSAYWYHKQFFHGISSISGKRFAEPIAQRMGPQDTIEGLCHQCHQYTTICNNKKKKTLVLWYRHAHKCHIYDKPKSIKQHHARQQRKQKQARK